MAEPGMAMIAALVDTLVDEIHPAAPADRRVQVRDYVAATVAGMPDHLGLALRLVALFCEFASLPRHRGRFSRLPRASQRRQVAAWRLSRLGPLRGIVAFCATFSLYGLHSLEGETKPGAQKKRIAA